MELLLARALAGHDKGRTYVVLGEDGADVILVDGRKRTLENPKRKRRTHVQRIKHFPQSILREAEKIDRWTDERVRKMIGLYLNLNLKEENKIV